MIICNAPMYKYGDFKTFLNLPMDDYYSYCHTKSNNIKKNYMYDRSVMLKKQNLLRKHSSNIIQPKVKKHEWKI